MGAYVREDAKGAVALAACSRTFPSGPSAGGRRRGLCRAASRRSLLRSLPARA